MTEAYIPGNSYSVKNFNDTVYNLAAKSLFIQNQVSAWKVYSTPNH